ncbi:MAG: NHLP leader peptide family RiPP precursor [Caldilineaceae bacterium]|nr:NHLP leader peptide family RiPP precursor [Caldilineaceae bacterium]MCB0140743.1 NHLP leader peptide family RiPP precursor [Caldilineaceae bacterium]
MNTQSNAYSRLVTKAWTDPDFKTRLLADPKAVMAESGLEVPEGIRLNIVEDTSDIINIVLPASPAGGALSEQDLEKVAGGTFSAIFSCYEWC